MKDYTTWYNELISDQIWYEHMSMIHRNKDFAEVSKIMYGEYVSDPVRFKDSMSEQRKHLHYKLFRSKPAEKKTVVEKLPEFKSAVNVDYLKGEERDKYLEEMKNNLKGTKTYIPPKMSHKEIIEEGDWLPKKKEIAYDPDYYHEWKQKLMKFQEMTIRERHPDWTEEQIKTKIYELNKYN
jgi:hypothetical protein